MLCRGVNALLTVQRAAQPCLGGPDFACRGMTHLPAQPSHHGTSHRTGHITIHTCQSEGNMRDGVTPQPSWGYVAVGALLVGISSS